MYTSEVQLYDLAKELKNIHNIDKDISHYLTDSQKAELLYVLENNQAVLKLIKLLTAKNQTLRKNNRRIGRQRNVAEKDLKKQKDKNEELNREISQLKYELIELQSQIGGGLASFQEMLLADILERSEILKFIQELINAVQESK
ncbi:MAG: hypothetical protein QNJ55_04310 [Xenococcus sp. MO_188.B8]|nr:hypothetical protein [Xenococcus sp. MO_188.B8]